MEACRPLRSGHRRIKAHRAPTNCKAEAFVKTLKRDYVAINPRPDAKTVVCQLPFWFDDYNNIPD